MYNVAYFTLINTPGSINIAFGVLRVMMVNLWVHVHLLQDKIKFRFIFEPRLILNFLRHLALIIHELGLGDKEN